MNENMHERCHRIEFDEPSHTYFVDGKKIETSVTRFIHSFFSEFDPIAIVEKYYDWWQRTRHAQYGGLTKDEILGVWDYERDLGTLFHNEIEKYYNDECCGDESIIEKEWDMFLQFEEQRNEMQPWRTEMRIFCEELNMAGSVDMIYKKPNGKYAIYDWKRTKRIDDKQSLARGKYPLVDVPDTNYWHYALQLNVYKYILEKHYGYEVDEMCLVQMHPNLECYKTFKVPDMKKEVELMINVRLEKN